MRVVSVNVGMPREVEWRGDRVLTGIFKDPVDHPVAIRRLNLDGDGQADLTVHGGPEKAVYAYPSEHYADWQANLGRPLAFGAFGENLTLEGVPEAEVHVGDEFRVGSARLVATQPRMPCFKLGIRFGDPRMVRRFLESGWPGIYFAVVEEGVVAAGDPIERVRVDENRVSILEIFALILDPRPSPEALTRALLPSALAGGWREEFERKLGTRAGA